MLLVFFTQTVFMLVLEVQKGCNGVVDINFVFRIITLCVYTQQGYAFGRVGLCAYVRTHIYIYPILMTSFKGAARSISMIS